MISQWDGERIWEASERTLNTRVDCPRRNFVVLLDFSTSRKLEEMHASVHMMRWGRRIIASFHDQNFPESALFERGIDILVKLRKLFDSFKFSSLVKPRQPAHFPSHGSLKRFSRFERSFNAGPNFIPRILIKCSSVNIIRPSPSMLWSRKFCKEKKLDKKLNTIIEK